MKNLTLTVLIQTVFLMAQVSGTVPNLKFKLKTGKQVQLADLTKQGPVLIDFWATWCAPCKKEMVFLDQFQRTYGDSGLTILTINQDSQKSLSSVRSYVQYHVCA
jgi:thiol-disulfide isomerase/thioredoxin